MFAMKYSASILVCITFVTLNWLTVSAHGQSIDGLVQPLNHLSTVAWQDAVADANTTATNFDGIAPDKPSRLTCRSFLFTWPCQDSNDLKLDLCEPLVTDRPDFTEASSTVGRGVTQLEIGYTYTTDEVAGIRTDSHSYPEILIRQGLFCDWFELRVAYNAGVVNDGATRLSGSEDMYLGAKIGLTPQNGILPEMAIIPQATLQTGSDVFTSGEDLFGLNWVYSWSLNDQVSFAGSTQFNRTLDGTTTTEYTQWAQSVALGVGLTDSTSTYVEWYAFLPDNADTDPVEHYLNGGLAYLMNNNVQWDVRVGLGLNDASQDFFVGTGVSIRFQ
jgi:hypothetical protein